VEVIDRPRISGEPEWIEPSSNPTAGSDPLGLQTITTDRIIPLVVPGVLALSTKARYLSFYAFLLDQAKRQKIADNRTLSHFVKRREYEFALAVALCPRRCGGGANGANRARPAVRKPVDAFERAESVDSFLGGYGLYYRSPMRTLGLVAAAGTPYGEEVLPVDVLLDDRGDRLATAFRDSVAQTEYMRAHFTGTSAIPRAVIEEYASQACLCGLGEERSQERDAIRDVMFEPGGLQPEEEVRLRREAFALVIRYLPSYPGAIRDDGLRAAVWEEFEKRDETQPSLASCLARWAALAGRDFAQDAIANLWSEAGRALLEADSGEGLPPDDVRAVLSALGGPTVLDLPEGKVAIDPSMSTREFRDAVVDVAALSSLHRMHQWSVKDGSAAAGLAFLFAMYARLPDAVSTPADWRIIGAISGDREPGLLALGGELDRHLDKGPTLAQTLTWAFRLLVQIPHERTANSKLPEFTHRFRWEAGRLTVFNFLEDPFARFGLNDIRANALARLSMDLGFVRQSGRTFESTEDGHAFAERVFGA